MTTPYFAAVRSELMRLGVNKAAIDALESATRLAVSADSAASTGTTDITTLQGQVASLQTDVASAQAAADDAALLVPATFPSPEEIAAVIGGPAITASWFNVKDYGAQGDGTTDDTSAIQATINACNAAGGGVVYFPRGVYAVGGALQDTSRSNAQLLLPITSVLGTTAVGIELRGEAPPPSDAAVSVTGTAPSNYLSVIKGTLNTASGSAPCLIGAHGASTTFTNVYASFRDLAVQMPSDPALTAIDLSCVAQADLDNVVIHTGTWDIPSIALQTTSTSYGLKTPGINNGALTRLGIVTVIGFYNGIQVGEHCVVQDATLAGCRLAVAPVAGNHASHFLRLLVQWCQTGIKPSGTHYLNIDQLDIEHANTGTWLPLNDIDDASNLLHGRLWWHVVLANTGPDSTFTVSGGANLAYRKLDKDYITSPTTGALAKWNDTLSLTAGNLSGDVTTSNSLVATLAASGASAGTYSNATVTVNAKGLVTSISAGTSAAYLPLVTGAEPPVLVSDGAGHLIAVGYTP